MEKEFIRTLDESINLQNCFINMYFKMVSNPNIQIREFAALYGVKENKDRFINALKKNVVNNLIKELLVLVNQTWKSNPKYFDESLIKQRTIFNMIKNKISINGQKFPFNTKELYKKIRESIAHNSKDKQNCQYNLKVFKLNLGQVDGKDYIIELRSDELLSLIYVLTQNATNNAKYSILLKGEDDSDNAYDIVTKTDVKEHIKIDDNSIERDLDNAQIDRVYNYIKFFNDATDNDWKNIVSLPDNEIALTDEKIKALMLVLTINPDITWKDVTHTRAACRTKTIVDSYYTIIANLLFEIVSSRSTEELVEIFEGTNINLSNDDIRHLRNSLCHGRYFHNYMDKFYFYDGKKDLELKVTLTMNDINKLLDKVAKGEKRIVL